MAGERGETMDTLVETMKQLKAFRPNETIDVTVYSDFISISHGSASTFFRTTTDIDEIPSILQERLDFLDELQKDRGLLFKQF